MVPVLLLVRLTALVRALVALLTLLTVIVTESDNAGGISLLFTVVHLVKIGRYQGRLVHVPIVVLLLFVVPTAFVLLIVLVNQEKTQAGMAVKVHPRQPP